MGYDIDVELQAGSVLLAPVELSDLPTFRRVWDEISEETAAARSDSVAVENVRLDPPFEHLLVRVYTPMEPEASPRPAVLMMHSGGFVGGSVDSIHAEALEICAAVRAIVVAPAYRLAPENPYPAALEDCVAALDWLLSADLDVDSSRVALHGTSAGGALAAALALRCRDAGREIAFVYLNAPELDDRLETPSMREFVDTPCFTRHSAVISWESYLGGIARGSADVPVFAAPGRAGDLTDFPATYIAVMQFDPLRDEGIAFAQRLLAQGIPVELHVFPQTFHGSSVIAHAEVSRRESLEQIAVLRRRLRTPTW